MMKKLNLLSLPGTALELFFCKYFSLPIVLISFWSFPVLAADPEPELSVELGSGIRIEFVLVKPGTFIMGSKKGWDHTEEPAHEVTITRPYYLGKFEVTQAQWLSVVGDNPGSPKDKIDSGNRPVNNVSWDDIMTKFIPNLAKRMPPGLIPRLPTEAEWEYACRAGSQTSYCYGDNEYDMGPYGWYDANAGWVVQPVGDRKPNDWGLYDMHGNVWEWCSDWMDSYEDKKATDPTGPAEGALKALRGGCIFIKPSLCRSTFRIGFATKYRGDNVGFRIAVTAPAGKK